MAKILITVVVLAIEERQEGARMITFAPIDKEGNTIQTESFRTFQKNPKTNDFQEGELYTLQIDEAVKEEVKTKPLSKKEQEKAAKLISDKEKEVETLSNQVATLEKEMNDAKELNPEDTQTAEAMNEVLQGKKTELEKAQAELQELKN